MEVIRFSRAFPLTLDMHHLGRAAGTLADAPSGVIDVPLSCLVPWCLVYISTFSAVLLQRVV